MDCAWEVDELLNISLFPIVDTTNRVPKNAYECISKARYDILPPLKKPQIGWDALSAGFLRAGPMWKPRRVFARLKRIPYFTFSCFRT
jgi:hypothetical protein